MILQYLTAWYNCMTKRMITAGIFSERTRVLLPIHYNGNTIRSQFHHVSDIYTLRIAEGYLNLAEAYAMEDNFQGANQYLRLLRESRIRNYVHTTYTGEKLVEEIRLERRRELCFEGHRWFDLRRYAVCEKYPYSKQIRHAFNVYDGNKYEWDHTDIYVLEKNDPAYVMQIPKSVLEYDEEQMPENPRNKRSPHGDDE